MPSSERMWSGAERWAEDGLSASPDLVCALATPICDRVSSRGHSPARPTVADSGRRQMSRSRTNGRLRAPRHAGFTLLEMLAVIVLIGIIGTVVAVQVSGDMQKGKYRAGKAQLITLSQEIENYALDNGSPPSDLNALVAAPSGAPNWLGPYAKPSQLNDPYSHAFGYRYPGKHGSFDLIFYGADGKAGGSGMNKDLGNWQ